MAKAPGVLGGKALTDHLRKLANETIKQDDGTELTREAALAALVWKLALGYTEETRDANGAKIKKFHPPVAWAQQFIFERMEGKATTASPEEVRPVKAAETVRALARERINAMSQVAGGPPRVPPKGV